VTRRTLLRSFALWIGIEPARIRGLAPWPAPDVAAQPLGTAGPSPGTRLSPLEIDDLIAFAEMLVVGRPLGPDERRDLVENIEERAGRDQEYLALYRTTATLLERLAGARFATVDGGRRAALVARHRLAVRDVFPGESLGPWPDEIREVRTRAVRNLIEDYYASPSGWAVVGYDVFPGRCGELTRYTRPEP
jgi:hypothetical protein